MGAFSDLGKTSRGYTSNPLRPGTYIARIDSCDSFDTRKGLMWKNSLTILAIEDGGDKPHRVGEQVDVFFTKGQYPEVFLQNIKAFIAGVTGAADEDVGEEQADLVLSDDNPLAGVVTRVKGVTRTSKSGKNDDGTPKTYTVFQWDERLADDEVIEAIGEEGVAQYFPNGL